VSRPIAIEAGTLLTPSKHFSPGRVIIEGESVAEAGHADSVKIPAAAETIDASQYLVAPGFIDPHIHGCGGVDVMEGTWESLNAISQIVARHGTTSFLPTTVSAPSEILSGAVEKLGALMRKSFAGARPIGIHLEGPFISAAKRGTHKAAHVVVPDAPQLERWIQLSSHSIRLLTVAPELDGIEAVTRMAKASQITVAMGHSNATAEEAHTAWERGICYAVHTFNAMRGFTHRDPGIVGEVLSNDGIFAEIIADGIHVNPGVVRLFARAKQKEKVLLVTDAISATDMPDGRYILGTDTVEVVNGVCRDAEGRLAGSTLSQEVALKNFVGWTGWTLEDALLSVTVNPAKALGFETKGVLERGADADIAIMDRNFRVVKTFVGGKLVWTS
jgi:N-acetylglucosamine-6-phosphate deacetylase